MSETNKNGNRRLIGMNNRKADSTLISSYSFTLDPVGNRTKASVNEPLPPALLNLNQSYTYDDSGRILTAGPTSYTFSNNGNTVAATGGGIDATYFYDPENRLKQLTKGTDTYLFAYNGTGNRLKKTVNGAETRYIVDVSGRLSQVIAETDSAGATTAYYVHGLGLISKVNTDGTHRYYHFNPQGATVAISDDSQTITDSYTYDVFGKLTGSTGSTENPFKYLGQFGVADDENGLLYIRARYYEPELGRFVSKDTYPVKERNTQGLSKYGYAMNNPIVMLDINGYCPQNVNYIDTSDSDHKPIFDQSEPEKYLAMDSLAGVLRNDGSIKVELINNSLSLVKDFSVEASGSAGFSIVNTATTYTEAYMEITYAQWKIYQSAKQNIDNYSGMVADGEWPLDFAENYLLNSSGITLTSKEDEALLDLFRQEVLAKKRK